MMGKKICSFVVLSGAVATVIASAPASGAAPTVVSDGSKSANNACNNPSLATDLRGWGSMDGAVTSRDSVGDLSGTSWAFDTHGRRFFQPEFTVRPGQTWRLSVKDRLLGAMGSTSLSVDWYDSAGRYLSSTGGRATALPQSDLQHGTWTTVTATATAPPQAAEAHVLQTAILPTGAATMLKATSCDYESSTPSGVDMPVGDLPGDARTPTGYRQIFTDDFTGGTGRAASDGSLPGGLWWGYEDGTRIANSSNGEYKPSTVVTESGGLLRFALHATSTNAYAAVESPLRPTGQVYGRWDVRYRYETGSNIAGYKSVWMLWPDDDHWGEGEIDFAEYGNEESRAAVEGNLHRACGNDAHGCPTDSGSVALDPTAWHTSTVTWAPGRVDAYTDGKLLASSTTQVPSTAMHLLLQTEASDYGPQAAPGSAMHLDVDWVVGYARR